MAAGVVAGRRCSYGDAADRQRDRANGGLCAPLICFLSFLAAREARRAPPGSVELTFRVSSCTEVAAGAGGISCRVALAIAARSIRL